MDLGGQASLVGRIIGNLQSLEFAMRVYLYDHESEPHQPLFHGRDAYDGNLGERLPLNALTSYDSLREVIDKYNRQVSTTRPQLAVDPGVADLRDAIAHGRVSAPADGAEDLTLVKFSRPEGASVKITFKARLTAEWLGDQLTRTHNELMKAAAASGAKAT